MQLIGGTVGSGGEHSILSGLRRPLEAAKSPAQIIVPQLDTGPSSAQAFANFTGYAAAGKRINHVVAFVGKHADEEFR